MRPRCSTCSYKLVLLCRETATSGAVPSAGTRCRAGRPTRDRGTLCAAPVFSCPLRRCRARGVSAPWARPRALLSTFWSRQGSRRGRFCPSVPRALATRPTSPSRPLRATPTSSTSMTLPPRACSTARSTQAAPGGTTLRAWITEHSTASALTCSPARCAALLPSRRPSTRSFASASAPGWRTTRSLWRSRVRTTVPRGRRGKIRSAGAIWQRSMPPGPSLPTSSRFGGAFSTSSSASGDASRLRAYRWNRDYGRPAHLRGGRQR